MLNTLASREFESLFVCQFVDQDTPSGQRRRPLDEQLPDYNNYTHINFLTLCVF